MEINSFTETNEMERIQIDLHQERQIKATRAHLTPVRTAGKENRHWECVEIRVKGPVKIKT